MNQEYHFVNALQEVWHHGESREARSEDGTLLSLLDFRYEVMKVVKPVGKRAEYFVTSCVEFEV